MVHLSKVCPPTKSGVKASSPEEAVGTVKDKTISERHEKEEVLRRGMKATSPTSRGRRKSKGAAVTKAAAITTTTATITATTTTIITAASRKKEKELINEGQRRHWKL